MRTATHLSITVAGLAMVTAGLPLAAPAQAAAETCQGKTATIVQTGGTVNGTDGDDVIVAKASNASEGVTVLAGAGSDTVCVDGPGRADGGAGIDSIEFLGDASDTMNATVIDFEHLDVRIFANLGSVTLEWTQVPSELSGAVDASYRPDSRSAMVLDNPTAYLTVPETSEYGIRVDRRSEKVALGAGLDFTLTGVNDIGMTAHKIRAFGDDARNYFFLTGCDVVARGGDGNDRLWMTGFKKIDRACPGARLFGQRGPDKLAGTNRNDTLIGGQDKDRAYGGKGRDRCVAEKKEACER
jgi:Ca2+-binding RTX toxin-like protein